ncbi:MAG: UV DNA damage repair endonuclease UvsE [Deltaproteobacteria bacterium]|nr:UV DNA damage repair endonuclease UvsE [Deltaproteobacteria bacterium]
MIRFGLCCIFREEPIRFRRTTAKYLQAFSRSQQLNYLAEICRHNAHTLQKALQYCRDHDIKDFRINSQILPLKTHPEMGYRMEDLPFHDQIIKTFKDCGRFCRKHDIRTTFHPDQFILLSSPKNEVLQRSVADLIYQAEVARWVNADVINIHGGGAYGDKITSLNRLRKRIEQLPEAVRSRLTLENDDRVYAPKDLLSVCRDMDVPLVYDVHHHRCLPDGGSLEATTELALGTWNREPLFHLSSPKYGWESGNPRNHHDYIDADDFPSCWTNLDITVEVEAKAKELAVLKLKQDLIELVYKS